MATLHAQFDICMLFDSWRDRLTAFAFMLRYWFATPAERAVIRRQLRYNLAMMARSHR